MSISFFDDLGGLFHILVNFCHLDRSTNHQKLNVIQKPTFNFLKILFSILVGGGATSANFLNFSTFSNHFTPKWLKMTHNGKFCQKNGLDWLKMANFAHFVGFPIFSPKMRLRLTWNGQFHPIHNFSHLLPPKHLIFGEISNIFIPGVYISNFFEFFNFFESF